MYKPVHSGLQVCEDGFDKNTGVGMIYGDGPMRQPHHRGGPYDVIDQDETNNAVRSAVECGVIIFQISDA